MQPIVVNVPIRIESSLNLRENWRKRANRNTSHRSAAYFALRAAVKRFDPAVLPCVVTITRIAPRELDSDNAIGGAKSVRDGVADWLGCKDNDKRIEWRYLQRSGGVREYGCEIEIAPRAA